MEKLPIALCVFLISTFVNAQPDTECLTQDLLANLVSCVTYKFEQMVADIESSSYSQAQDPYESDSRASGRHLQSSLPLGDPNAYLPNFVRTMETKHRKVFDQMIKAAQLDRARKERDVMLEGVKNIDFRFLFGEYFTEILHYATELGENNQFLAHISQVYMNYANDNETGNEPPDLPAILCDILNNVTDGLCDVITCINGYTETDFEDGIDWLQCLYKCEDLPEITMCMQDTFEEECPDWSFLTNIVMKVLVDILQKDKCYIDVKVTDEPLQLAEGGPAQELTVVNFLPPRVYCIDLQAITGLISLIGIIREGAFSDVGCPVTVQVSTENYLDQLLPNFRLPFGRDILGRPKCFSGEAVSQVMIGWSEQAVNASGIIPITDDNWNKTFRIPVQASVDHKEDGDNDIRVTVKLLAGRDVKRSVKINVSIV